MPTLQEWIKKLGKGREQDKLDGEKLKELKEKFVKTLPEPKPESKQDKPKPDSKE